MTHDDDVFSMQISHVRAILGYACREVARTGRPLGIRRYRALDVVLVPLAEWQRLKRLEHAETEEHPGGTGVHEEDGDVQSAWSS
ncbi:MAG: hypothetical protein KA383_20550 [Phycisphaerae bacterium]|nr:hypothetical protein [Phycisphaerae bacterium]